MSLRKKRPVSRRVRTVWTPYCPYAKSCCVRWRVRTLEFRSPRFARPVTRRVGTLEFRNPAHKDTRVLQSAMRQTGHAARKAGHFCSPRCFSGVRARCFSGVRLPRFAGVQLRRYSVVHLVFVFTLQALGCRFLVTRS